jgi:excinuclease UvrABC nuclease subunit
MLYQDIKYKLNLCRVLSYQSCVPSKLPKQPGLYYVLDSTPHVLYVGLAGERHSNLHARWNSYTPHKMSLLTKVVHYRVCPRHKLRYLEALEIQRFQPPYNIQRPNPSQYRGINVLDYLLFLSFVVFTFLIVVL